MKILRTLQALSILRTQGFTLVIIIKSRKSEISQIAFPSFLYKKYIHCLQYLYFDKALSLSTFIKQYTEMNVFLKTFIKEIISLDEMLIFLESYILEQMGGGKKSDYT